jgi:serine/threonine-protein kinase
LLQLCIELSARSGAHARAEAALLEAARDRLFDLTWLDRCVLLDPLRERPAFAEARALVDARAEAVRAALTAPLT